MDQASIAARIKELKDNYQAGQGQLRSLEAQQRELQNTMLRISGAIQVLEELQQELQQEQPVSSQERAMHIAR
ncbi:hypothetical protein [Paraherbaspirillum soli]|uniref:Uncharacterized protein n=1 Tax=Paraherbaspirillum soli TaxID=631222 RepID=A0ABW0MC00_9BURK